MIVAIVEKVNAIQWQRQRIVRVLTLTLGLHFGITVAVVTPAAASTHCFGFHYQDAAVFYSAVSAMQRLLLATSAPPIGHSVIW